MRSHRVPRSCSRGTNSAARCGCGLLSRRSRRKSRMPISHSVRAVRRLGRSLPTSPSRCAAGLFLRSAIGMSRRSLPAARSSGLRRGAGICFVPSRSSSGRAWRTGCTTGAFSPVVRALRQIWRTRPSGRLPAWSRECPLGAVGRWSPKPLRGVLGVGLPSTGPPSADHRSAAATSWASPRIRLCVYLYSQPSDSMVNGEACRI